MDSSEAVVRRCSIKKVFLKIPKNSQENTSAGDSFLPLLFIPRGEIWLGQIHQLTSVGRFL